MGRAGQRTRDAGLPGELAYWKWVLTPGGPTAIEAGLVLTVEFEDGTSETVDGYFPGRGHGAVHFDAFGESGTVDSASVAFSGGGDNALLTISEGDCVPDEDPEDPKDPDEPNKKEQKKKEAKKKSK